VDISIFDLPTETRKERKIASSFRKKLLDDGFSMLQFSIYMRFCAREKCRSTHQENKKIIYPNTAEAAHEKRTKDTDNFLSILVGDDR
jgi:CRISPR-associated endonuclease Cas2